MYLGADLHLLRRYSEMQRTASAHWSGGLKDGKGTISSQSGVLKRTRNTRSALVLNQV